MNNLAALARKYNCDKLYAHSYIDGFYAPEFRYQNPKLLLEIGIGFEELMKPFVPQYTHGSSLKMWAEYFPSTRIVGCDIRADVQFQEGRIATYVADQSSPVDMLRLIGLEGRPDIIIDDGSHEPEHQVITCTTLLPYLKPGGLYVIEDVRAPQVLKAAFPLERTEVHQYQKRPDDCLFVLRK